MPENTSVMRRCRDCDGFPTVAITTGQTTPTGERETLPVTCRTCHGTGTRAAFAGRLARVAR